MNSRSPRFETPAYLIALLVAAGLRFVSLGAIPLTDPEATLALQSLHIAQGLKPALGSNVAYVNLTALTFFVFGASDFLARFWPALAGSALVLAPWLFRERIKPRPAIILAFFLAIDPALVAASRTAGGSTLVLAGFLLSVGFWQRGQMRLAGIFAALALLGGPSLWAGLLGLLLTWMILQGLMAGSKIGEEPTETKEADAQPSAEIPAPEVTVSFLPPNPDYRSMFLSGGIALLAISTLLLFSPQGVAAWLTSLPEYILGWVRPSSSPASHVWLALIVYQPMAVLLAVIAIVRGWVNGSKRIILLSLWAVVALLLAVFYQARQPVDLVWALIPLWTMAAIELNRHVLLVREDRMETVGVVAFTLILIGFAWMDFTAITWVSFPSTQASLRLYMLVGAVVLFIVSVVLVGYGWSERIARVGAAWGLAVLFGFYTIGAAWGATGLRTPNGAELYQSGPTIAQADLLARSVKDISEWSVGSKDYLPVLVYGVDSPALLWTLRDHNPQVVTVLDPTASPALVVTPPMQDLQLAAAYRGQDFNWRQTPSWDVFSTYRMRWLTLRDLPQSSESLVLWARDDLFIDVP